MSRIFTIILLSILACAPVYACTIKIKFIDWDEIADMQKRLSLQVNDGNEIELKGIEGEFSFDRPTSESLLFLYFEGYRYQIPFRADLCDSLQLITIQEHFATSAEVVLTGHRDQTTVKNIAAPIALISSQLIKGTDSFSLLPAMNTISGVSMESRGFGGSHRLSIRGSALRSPFAVRNIKMYIDGIPVTSPDGQTPLELMDAADIERLEIIKGPASTVYGSGNGGVILAETPRIQPGKTTARASFQAGSFGSYRSTASATIGMHNGGFRISHVWQDVLGYREQEGNHKNQFTMTYQGYLSEKQRITAYLTYFDGLWELPGGLNSVQRDTMPMMAVNFSKLNGAKLQRERIHGGIGHRYKGKFFQEETVLYYTNTQKENPYGTSKFNNGFKHEWADGFGGRSDMTVQLKSGNNQFKFKAGGEWQSEKYSIIENEIDQGISGDMKYTYDVGYIQSTIYGMGEMNLGEILSVTAGISKGFTMQDIEGFTADDFNFDTTLKIQRQWLPRAAGSIHLNKQWQIYQSYSQGNSLPTIFEVVDNENNTYNLSLRPERGVNNEYGLRYSNADNGIDLELGYYNFRLKDAILPYQNENNITLYHNAGETLQRGIEWSLRYHVRNNSTLNTTYSDIQFWTSGSYFNYTFLHYEVEGSDLSGNAIPGIPKAQINAGIQTDIHHRSRRAVTGFQLTHYQYLSQILTNDGTVNTDPYSLLNLNISHEMVNGLNVVFPVTMRIFAGINNLLNVSYTSFHQYNASEGNYYNPCPLRNYYSGIQFVFN
ncbi:MAG: TonB-dependent receptor [Flavobacteriales bacterium]